MTGVFTPDSEPNVEADHGDDEDFRSLLVHVRKFVMNDEPACFYRVANELQTRLTDVALRNLSTANRNAWKKSWGPGDALRDGNWAFITRERMFNVYAYGGVFHDDPARKAEWTSLDAS